MKKILGISFVVFVFLVGCLEDESRNTVHDALDLNFTDANISDANHAGADVNDADYLDGLDSTAFLRLIGGTLTGNLNIKADLNVGDINADDLNISDLNANTIRTERIGIAQAAASDRYLQLGATSSSLYIGASVLPTYNGSSSSSVQGHIVNAQNLSTASTNLSTYGITGYAQHNASLNQNAIVQGLAYQAYRLVLSPGTEGSGKIHQFIGATITSAVMAPATTYQGTLHNVSLIAGEPTTTFSNTNYTLNKAAFVSLGDSLFSTDKRVYLEGGYDNGLTLGNTYLDYNSINKSMDFVVDGNTMIRLTDRGIQNDMNILGALALGTNTTAGLSAGDANVSTLYYDTLTAKSPLFFCSDNWCMVTLPEYQATYYIQKDANWNILTVKNQDGNQIALTTIPKDIRDRITTKTTYLQNRILKYATWTSAKRACENNTFSFPSFTEYLNGKTSCYLDTAKLKADCAGKPFCNFNEKTLSCDLNQQAECEFYPWNYWNSQTNTCKVNPYRECILTKDVNHSWNFQTGTCQIDPIKICNSGETTSWNNQTGTCENNPQKILENQITTCLTDRTKIWVNGECKLA